MPYFCLYYEIYVINLIINILWPFGTKNYKNGSDNRCSLPVGTVDG